MPNKGVDHLTPRLHLFCAASSTSISFSAGIMRACSTSTALTQEKGRDSEKKKIEKCGKYAAANIQIQQKRRGGGGRAKSHT
mmetsp:Transcript_250/g.304  ORF Transcript_250/g.304 Transcript_250/m.304 type:complete len:82 (+) Transcript_250:51-296(+)